jgi:hypothetical protein
MSTKKKRKKRGSWKGYREYLSDQYKIAQDDGNVVLMGYILEQISKIEMFCSVEEEYYDLND